jgi:hypothetical protein
LAFNIIPVQIAVTVVVQCVVAYFRPARVNAGVPVLAVPCADQPGILIHVVFGLRDVPVAIIVQTIADFGSVRTRVRVLVIAVRSTTGDVDLVVLVHVLVVGRAAAIVVDIVAAEVDRSGVDLLVGIVAIVAEWPAVFVTVNLVRRNLRVAVGVLSVAELHGVRMDKGILVVAVISTTRHVLITILVVIAGVGIFEEEGITADPTVSPKDFEIPVLSPVRIPAVLHDPRVLDIVIAYQDNDMTTFVFTPNMFIHAPLVVIEVGVDIESDRQHLLVQSALDGRHVVRNRLPLIDLPDPVGPIRAPV